MYIAEQDSELNFHPGKPSVMIWLKLFAPSTHCISVLFSTSSNSHYEKVYLQKKFDIDYYTKQVIKFFTSK